MCKLELTPLKVTLVLVSIIIFLLFAGIITQYIRYAYGDESQFGLVRLFDLEGENNLPSWYSSIEMLLSSATLASIGLQTSQERNLWAEHWLALAFGFLCLSADEAASIHEMAAPLLHNWLETTGRVDKVISVVGTAWLLAGIPVALVVLLMFWRFLRHLPFATRALFLVAGGLYITGAVGVEAAGGRYLAHGGVETLTYQMMVAVEEGLEMLGVVIFLYALMTYMATHRISLLVAFEHQTT